MLVSLRTGQEYSSLDWWLHRLGVPFCLLIFLNPRRASARASRLPSKSHSGAVWPYDGVAWASLAFAFIYKVQGAGKPFNGFRAFDFSDMVGSRLAWKVVRSGSVMASAQEHHVVTATDAEVSRRSPGRLLKWQTRRPRPRATSFVTAKYASACLFDIWALLPPQCPVEEEVRPSKHNMQPVVANISTWGCGLSVLRQKYQRMPTRMHITLLPAGKSKNPPSCQTARSRPNRATNRTVDIS